MRKLLLITTTILLSVAYGQETVSIMYYNLLKFPNTNSSRITYLKTIVQYVKPDIFVVNELTSGTGSNSILNNALNQDGVNYYSAATYVNGPDDNNMLYYNSNKFGLVDENVIPTSLRDINEYVLYYKDPALTAASDTAYLHIYGAHLKAGNSDSDAAQRAAETATLKSYLLTRENTENTIVGGDFNIYYSSESAYYNLTAPTQADLHDVIGPGAYHNNSSFTNIFTQSTRTDSFDGGSTGGMDDRFDFILFSPDLLDGSNNAQYVNGSYTAIGQDGIRWNSSLIIPSNSSEPVEIINALYYMSDHLPVYMEIEIGGNVGIPEYALKDLVGIYPNPTSSKCTVAAMEVTINKVEMFDLQGRMVKSIEQINKLKHEFAIDNLLPGSYYVNIITDKGTVNQKLIVNE